MVEIGSGAGPGAPPVLAGRYQLLECVGEGGMGVVWRAFDLDLEEPVAVKFLREELATDERLRGGFRREVKLARRVTHPNVARVFEFGRDGNTYFLTMEFISGESLLDVLQREGKVEPARLLPWLLALCRGLAAAHAAGVAHGDIKPGNILIAPDRGAVLTDFGIARIVSEVLSRDDVLGGTPLYMSPEQLSNEVLSPRSDVYAVGVVILEALTGLVPWPVYDAVGMVELKLRGDPDLRPLLHGLPEAWGELIRDCLRSEAERRPADGRALLSRLGALGGATRVGGAPEGGYPATAPLASGDGPRWLEIVPFTADGDEPMPWVTGDLIDALTQVRGLRVIAACDEDAAAKLEHVSQIRGAVQHEDDAVVASAEVVPARGGQPLATVTLRQPRALLHNLGADLAARLVAAIDPQRPTSTIRRHHAMGAEAADLYIRARNAFLSMRPDTAVQLYEAALARSPDHPLLQLGQTIARVKSAFFMFRRPDDAEIAELQRAIDRAVRKHDDLGEPHLAKAAICTAMNDLVAAATATRRSLQRAPSLVGAHVMLVHLLMDIARLQDAERHLDIALALDGSSVIGWTTRARLRAYQGRWDEFYALVEGKLAELRHRSPHLPRLMLWHPRREVFERLEPVFAENQDALPLPLCQLGRDAIALGLGREDPRALLDRLMHHPGFSHPRHAHFLAQVQCEVACRVGDLERAKDLLRQLDRENLTDRYWLEFSPAIAPLRDAAEYPELRARIRARADAVADALWG
jgi:serine/threonine-protein kinase